MNLDLVKLQFATMINFENVSENKWEVISPFFRTSGDMFQIYLIKKTDNKYVLSDDGYALVNLNTLVDVHSKDCVSIIKDICAVYDVKRLKDDSFEMEVTEENLLISLSQFSNFYSQIENLALFFD